MKQATRNKRNDAIKPNNHAGPELQTKTTRETDATKQGTKVEQSDKNDSESVYYADDDKDQDNREMKYVDEFSEEPSKDDKAGPEPPKDVTRGTLPPESDPPTIYAPVRPTSSPRSEQQQGQSKESRHRSNPSSNGDTARRGHLTSDSSEVASPARTSGARPPSPVSVIKGEDGDRYHLPYDETHDRIDGLFLNHFDEPADGRGVKDNPSLPSNGDTNRSSVTNKEVSETEGPEYEPFISSSENRKKKKEKEIYL